MTAFPSVGVLSRLVRKVQTQSKGAAKTQGRRLKRLVGKVYGRNWRHYLITPIGERRDSWGSLGELTSSRGLTRKFSPQLHLRRRTSPYKGIEGRWALGGGGGGPERQDSRKEERNHREVMSKIYRVVRA